MKSGKTFLVVLFLASLSHALAIDPKDYAVNIVVQIATAPPQIKLLWPQSDFARQYIIRRKSINDGGWSAPLATLPGNATSFTDSNVSLGDAFEYEIQEDTNLYPYPDGDPTNWISAFTYVYAGCNASLVDDKGKVLLVVDSSVAGAIDAELNLFQQDLVGDGWQVVRRNVGRDDSVGSVRDAIRAEYYGDPSNLRSVVLIGHVPVPYSGLINPDMHPGHLGAWPADVFYADVDGNWTDNSVTKTDSEYPENDNVPGDGKFDQSQIPSTVELEVGRIDFWDLPAFAPRSEVDLLRNYFHKDHNFRQRQFTLERRGIVHDNFGDIDSDAPAVDAWRHFPGFFPSAIREIGPDQFFPALNSDSYLWSYGCGGGSYTHADGVGSTADFAAGDPKTAFLMLHGSYFGDWNNEDNFLRAAIATPNYTLASIWTGLPHWYMHHMALGRTIGYSTKVSQNNLTLYQSHRNFSAGQVHISLIGDPTLQMFPVAPPQNLTAQGGTGVALSWSGSADQVVGYHVYRSQSPAGPFQRITGAPNGATSFVDGNLPQGTYYYMVRAIKLEQTGSGSFYNASQGIFASAVAQGGMPQLPTVTIAVEDGDASETGPNPGSFRITRSIVTALPLTVDLTISGTASNGVDYQTLPVSATIPASSASVLIPVTPIADNLVEGDETVGITIQESSTYLPGTPAAAQLTIKDRVANQPPTALSQTVQLQEDKTVNITLVGNDPEGAALTYKVTFFPEHGILDGAGANLVYTPNAGFSGADAFLFVVNDGQSDSTAAKVTLNVAAVNDPPVATPQSVATDEDTPLNITLSASDPDSAQLSFIIVAGPAKGVLSGSGANLLYTPNANVNGSDSFTFKANDGQADSAVATVNIQIRAVNDAPHAADDSFSTASGAALSLAPSQLLANDSDIDGDPITIKSVDTTSAQGGAVAASSSNILYTPKSGFTGTDSFSYTIQDNSGATATARVIVQVNPPARIIGIALQQNGSALIRFTGPPNRVYRVDASSDNQAKTWTTLGQGSSDASGSGSFTDADAKKFAFRLYRVEWL